MTIAAYGPGATCFTSSQSVGSVIAGFAVTITRGTAASPPSSSSDESARQELCAADADGLTIHIIVNGDQPAIDVTQVFAHMRLFGPDPALWTTKPVA